MTQTRVVHCNKGDFDVYVGRPTKWGNPFIIGRDGDRSEVIVQYLDWLVKHPELMDSLSELQGRVLGCWCAPRPCHGDILASLADYLCGTLDS